MNISVSVFTYLVASKFRVSITSFLLIIRSASDSYTVPSASNVDTSLFDAFGGVKAGSISYTNDGNVAEIILLSS